MKVKVKDISYFDYTELEDKSEYDFLFKYMEVEPLDLFELGEFDNKSTGFVKSFQAARQKDFTFEKYLETIISLENLQPKYLSALSLFKLIQSYDYAVKQIDEINKREVQYLTQKSDSKEQQASEGLFKDMGIFIQIDNFAGGDPLKYEACQKLPYSLFFAFTKLQVDRSIFKKELARLANQ